MAIARHFLPQSRLDSVVDRDETIVVAGLGPVGNAVVEALKHAGQPLMLVDRNEKLLAPWQGTADVRCHHGRIEDMDDWLPALGKRPRAVILTFPIPDTSALVAQRILQVDPQMIIIARSPYAATIDDLRQAGIQYVLCDEIAAAAALGPLLDRALGKHESSTDAPADADKGDGSASKRLRRSITRSFRQLSGH